jgi:uncharacterized membrane protein YdbT with pleckstrin-like domain
MSYVASVLREGETVTHQGKIHWIVYLRSIVLLVIAFLILFFTNTGPLATSDFALAGKIAAGLLALVAVWFGIHAFILRWSTELVTTNQRCIVKVGFIRRHTWEINAGKVEGVEVSQTILGRILDYGTILVKGTGSGSAPVRFVQAPVAFRNAVMVL